MSEVSIKRYNFVLLGALFIFYGDYLFVIAYELFILHIELNINYIYNCHNHNLSFHKRHVIRGATRQAIKGLHSPV